MRAILATTSAILLMTACGNGVEPAPDVVEWEGTVHGVQGWEQLSGSSSVTWTVGTQQFSTSIQMSGDEPGAVRPWHVHHGTCATSGGIVGLDGDYPRLNVGTDGTASVQTTVPTGLSVTAPYHVNVHLSDEEMAVIIACGDLAVDGTPGGGGGPGNGIPGPGDPGY